LLKKLPQQNPVGPQSKKRALLERKDAKLEEAGQPGETAKTKMTTTPAVRNSSTAMTYRRMKTEILRRQRT
jgi:hypothetical protein